MINFEYTRATTIRTAIDAAIKNPTAQFIAGGTNLVDLMKKGVTAPSRVIDINHLPLKDISASPTGGLMIGSLVTNSDLASDKQAASMFPLLNMALTAGASAQLRNMATVGGNMMQRTRCPYFYDTIMPCNKRKPGSGCAALKGYNRMHAIFGANSTCIAVHPSDMCVALLALDATVQISSPKGERTIAFTDFHKLPGVNPEKDNNLGKAELITSINIPANRFSQYSHYLKVRDRASYAFALVSVAAALDIVDGKIRDLRLAMGGVAHKPWRLKEAEQFLKGKDATVQNFTAAAKEAMKLARSYGHNDFKLQLAPAAIIDALTKASRIS